MGFYSKSSRKATAPIVLAMWLFALAVSIAHACGLDHILQHVEPNMPASAVKQVPTGDELPACVQFCSDDIPVLGKLKAVEDYSPGAAIVAPLLLAQPGLPHVYGVLRGLDPPPGIAINTHFIRLAL
jgi:hypothetical protein